MGQRIRFNAMAMKPLKTKFILILGCIILLLVQMFISYLRQNLSEYLYAKTRSSELVVDKPSRNTIPRADKLLSKKTFGKTDAPAILKKSHSAMETNDTLDLKFDGNIYGIGCPPNPYRSSLRRLFHSWTSLSRKHNISSFLCGGSLIGLVRNGNIIPYDRDIDVCMSDKEYLKLQQLETPKPFNYRDGRIYLVTQRDFFSKDVGERIRVDCKGREVANLKDPCSFVAPGARLIFRGRYLDVFVFREDEKHLNDKAYKTVHPVGDIYPLKPCVFMGIETKCPQNQTSLLLRYYEPNVVRKPHYVCRNKTWMPTSPSAQDKFKIWFH